MAVTNYADESFPEEGVRTVRLSLSDEEGDGVVPNSISFTLYNRPSDPTESPDIINSIEDKNILTEVDENSDGTVTVDIVLEGDDLAFEDGEDGVLAHRALVVKYQYDSDVGTDLDDKIQFLFSIERIFGVI